PWWSPASAYSRYRSWDVLCFLEFSIVDEPHGQRAAGDCVPERIGERQGRAASEHLGHSNAVGQPLVIRRADGFECEPRLAEEFAVAAETHLHRDLHARTRLIHRRRRPARSQRRYDIMKGVQRLVSGLRDRAGRRHGDRQRSTNEVSRGTHGWSRLSTKQMAIGRPATALGGAHRSSSLLGVGGDLHTGHAIGIDHRLALLDLVHYLHAREGFPGPPILAVDEGSLGIPDE